MTDAVGDLAGESRIVQLETSPLVMRLAVRASFDPDDFQGDELADVLRFCAIRLHRTDAREEWMLTESVRIEALAHALRNGGISRLRNLSESTPAGLPSATEALLEAWVLHDGWPPLEVCSEDELVAVLHVARWARAAIMIAGLPLSTYTGPQLEDIEGRLSVLEVTRPIRSLVRHPVLGREAELNRLRGHLYDPAHGPLSQAGAFCLFGIGGVGKSTLVAAFVDELVKTQAGRLLWAYLDFDRPALDPHKPFTIIADLYRQFGAQDPALALVANRARLELFDRQKPSGLESIDTRGSFREAVRELVDACGDRRRPMVVILDTCEEAQRIDFGVESLYDLMDSFAVTHEAFKLIVSGRSRVQQFEIPGHEWRVMEVGGLAPDAAAQVLQAQIDRNRGGASSAPVGAEFARQVVTLVGGNPLSLALAAQVLAHDDLSVIESAVDRARALGRVREEYVRGFLYKRVLDHLCGYREAPRREALRRVARASLALRYITPEVIDGVLRPIAQVPAAIPASYLHDDLAAELAFVDNAGPALRIREDVRRPALAALQIEDRAIVEQVHEAAQRYYTEHPDAPYAATEAAYHALAIGDDSVLAALDRNMLLSLQDSDLPETITAMIRTLVRAPDVDEKRVKDEEQRRWEQAVLSQADFALRTNDLTTARRLLFERDTRRPTTELFRLESRLLEAEGDLPGATDAAWKDLETAHHGGTAARASAAAVRVALLLERLLRAREGIDALEETEHSPLLTGNTELQLELLLDRITIAERASLWTDEDRWLPSLAARRRMRILGGRFETNPTLVRLVAATFGFEEPEYLRLALQRVGLLETRPELLDRLALEISRWDDGSLANAAGVANPGVIEWRDRISASGLDAGHLLFKLWTTKTPPEPAREAMRAVFLAWGLRSTSPATIPKPVYPLDDVPLDFKRPEVQELERILLTIYPSTRELTYVVTKAGIDPAQINFNNSLTFVVRDVLTLAAMEGRLRDLVRLLLKAAPPKIKPRLEAILGITHLDTVAHEEDEA